MKHRAVFLDRDGVINQNKDDYVKSIDELKILPYASQAINLLNKVDFKVVVITNQSVVNRGLVSLENLGKIHEFLRNQLLQKDAKIDAIYFCPHSPDDHCTCRKPEPALILRAAKDLEIDLSNSYMIGDRESDRASAERAGVKFIPMKTDGNLLETVKSLLSKDE